MFLPWKDDNPTRRTPWVTFSLLGAYLAVFIAELLAADPGRVFLTWGLVPARIAEAGLFDGAAGATLFTSMFLHGGFLHLASNGLYLWIFANNVEDVLGPVRFLAFYLLAGLGGHAAHVLSDAESLVPTVGASGAIAGILGAYLLRFPSARVHTLVYLIFIFGNFRVPAAIVISGWFLVQLFGGLGAVGGAAEGGIAWFEHLGGFVAGILLFPLLGGRRVTRPPRW